MVDFGQRLKELRKTNGLTQQQLADKLGITKSVVSYYELSERCPSPEIIIKLADIFHTTTDCLLGVSEKINTVDISDLTNEEQQLVYMLIETLRKK